MNLRKRGLALLMCICMVFTLLPFSALADEAAPAPAKTIYVDAISGNDSNDGSAMTLAYKTVAKAVSKAADGDTIQLGEGEYSTYGNASPNKTLTFVGADNGKTKWYIGSPTPNEQLEGTEYNGDYSFDGCEKITFKNIEFSVYSSHYKGFIRIKNVIVDGCTIKGFSTYWGYNTTLFKNTVFNCPDKEYALWYYTGQEMTFDNCTFNSSGKVINVYREVGDGSSNTAENPYVLNFMNCTVNSSESNKSVLNIKDNTHYYNINISGTNVITGLNPNSNTCSKLFQVEGVGDNYNLSGGKGNGQNCRATVKIDGETVWENGKMVSHEYTDGYKDNAFTEETKKLSDRTVTTRTCKYCGWTEESTVYNWNIPLSKTATEFDKDYKTDVTLSVPGVQQSLDSDVVFVLDGSSSAETDVVKQSLSLLNDLKQAASDNGATVNVCVVKFKRQAVKSAWFDLAKQFSDIKNAMETKYSGGTNIHAGLLAGKEALDEHDNVSANRKYLILISDGSTYLYSNDGDWANERPFTRSYYTKDNYQGVAGGFNDQGLYNPSEPNATKYDPRNVARPTKTSDVAAWQAYFADVEARNETVNSEGKTGNDYDYRSKLVEGAWVLTDEFKSQPTEPRTANNRDMAYYYADQTWQLIKAAGYNAFSIAVADGSAGAGNSDDSHCFMNYLNEGKSLNFSDIKNKILYAVGTGSYVVDKIGDDFTLDENTLRVKVGEDQYLDSIKLNADEEGNWVQYFGDAATQLSEDSYLFKVEYNAADKTLTWTFNENVSNFAPVQLTYTLKLTKPETKPGTYGQLDLNGDGTIDKTTTAVDPGKALYTNESAVLNPIASNCDKGLPVKFPMPSLAYTVEKPYIPPVDPSIRDKITVEITGNSDSVVYDGTEHSVKDYTVKISDSRYTEKDFTFSGKALASGINAGAYEMGLKADQFKNTNARFKNVEFIIKADGVLTITQRPLTITAGSAEGIAPVTCDKYTVEGLATGDKVDSVKLTGIQSEPGESPNVASDAVIKNAKGEDVTANYKITYVDGVLKAIEVLNKEIHFNYVIGYTDGTIRPNNDISRAEVATIFFRLLTDEAREQYTTTAGNFTDVKAGMWCNRAIATLTNMGIIKGYTDGSFQPNKSITRAELATIIARFAKLDVNTKTFSDINGHWAQKNIELAAGNGWINGYEDGTFRPNNNITRAETFAMINRVLDRQTESVSDLLPTSEMNMWSDNLNENAWYYKDVQEATNYHKCDRVGDSVYEKWTEKVPDIDWASYQI